jgi:hypothetical protein
MGAQRNSVDNQTCPVSITPLEYLRRELALVQDEMNSVTNVISHANEI